MNVFILHAEKDQAAADDLLGYLKSHGMVVTAESGARGFRHLQASDVVVALWSNNSVFSTYRMIAEKRMLDAWADGQLVLVKLDHSFLPVGMRDLPALDASFEVNRKLAVWPQVERAARDAMNTALVRKQKTEDDAKGGPGGGEGRASEVLVGGVTADRERKGQQQQQQERTAPAAKGGGSFLALLFTLAALGALGWAGYRFWLRPEDAETTRVMTYVTYAVGGLGALLLLTIIAQLFRPSPKARAAKKAAARPKSVAASAPAPAAEAFGIDEAPTAVFVSYAHADTSAVEPVVRMVQDTGHTVWVDKGGIQAGEGWAGEIVRAIKGARGVVIMCSPRAFESDHIKREVYLADRYKKPMFPLFLEPAQIPEDFEYFFAGVQWLELFKLSEAERPDAIGKALAGV